MGTSRRWKFAGLAAMGLAGLPTLTETRSTAADAKSGTGMYKPVVPADSLNKLITEDGKALRDAVAKAADKKMASKARSVAFLIAVYAQDEALRGGGNAAAMAGLRDSALKVAKAVADGKLDEAKKLAAEVKPGGAGEAGANTTAASLQENFDIETLMQVFKPERGGGLEWEKKLLTLKDKRSAYTAADYQTLVPLMYRIATIAQPTEAFAPEPMGKKNPADWTRLAKEMGSEAVAVAELAKKTKPDDKAVKAAVKRLEGTCASCHDKFRDAN
jgi:hypothetical protein